MPDHARQLEHIEPGREPGDRLVPRIVERQPLDLLARVRLALLAIVDQVSIEYA